MSRWRVGLIFVLAANGGLFGQGLTIQGHVFGADGARLGGAAVTIEGSSRYVAVTDGTSDLGHYTSPGLSPGMYKITVSKDGYDQKIANPVTVDTEGRVIDFVLDAPCGIHSGGGWEFWGTVLAVMLFLASIWLVRWFNIAQPNREMLRAEIDNAWVRLRSHTLDIPVTDPRIDVLLQLLTKARATIEVRWNISTLLDFLFWSRGQEITGWSRIREFQRDAIEMLAAGTPEVIRATLQSTELDLLDIERTHAKTLAANIKEALDAKPPADVATLRALLVEGLTYLNDDDVNTFAQLVGWQTKAVWLSGVGCSLVIVLAYAVGNPVLFIAGAAGGFLSRLARTLKRADVPTDYGASWTTLFLSPIVGGLSGWFGILLIIVLADPRFGVLGSAFQAIRWCNPTVPFTLGIAFLMGFSERLFDGIISSLEDKVDADRKAATEPQQPTSSAVPPAAEDSGNNDKTNDKTKVVETQGAVPPKDPGNDPNAILPATPPPPQTP